MDHFTRLLPSSLTRFYDNSPTGSDSEGKNKSSVRSGSSSESYEHISGSEVSSESSEKAYENMAFVSCNDEQQQNKDGSSSFLKNFPDFMKLKLSDKKESESISNSIPEQRPSNYGSITTSPDEKSISSNESEREPVISQVTTIITEPDSSPKKESPKKTEQSSTVSRKEDRRNTENVLFFEGATLSPVLDTRRRHSTDMVSVPKPINEELIENFTKTSPPTNHPRKKKSLDETDSKPRRRNMDSMYSPRAARKKQETENIKTTDQRRPTLAELAKNAGYKPPPRERCDTFTSSLMVSHERKISTSDDDERDGKGELVITGELYLTLEYCIKTKTFSIHVHSANNLAATKKETIDPYVKTYLLPDKRSKKKTKIIKDNLNPEFDEILKYSIGYDELLTRTLAITVWNDRFGVNDFLGEVLVDMSKFVDAGNALENSQAKWYHLCHKTEHDESMFVKQPEMILSLKYVTADKVKRKGKRASLPAKGELHLHVMEAKNLPGKDADGMSDPFCKISLLPDKKGKSRHKTAIIKRTLNPSWDYNVAYDELSQDDLRERVLEISVWDHDIASRDEFLGGVRLGLGTSLYDWDDANEDEAQIWHTMLTRTNVWIQVVVPLRPNMDSHKH